MQPEEGADSTGDAALICSILIHLPFLISSSGIKQAPPLPSLSVATESLAHTHKPDFKDPQQPPIIGDDAFAEISFDYSNMRHIICHPRH